MSVLYPSYLISNIKGVFFLLQNLSRLVSFSSEPASICLKLNKSWRRETSPATCGAIVLYLGTTILCSEAPSRMDRINGEHLAKSGIYDFVVFAVVEKRWIV